MPGYSYLSYYFLYSSLITVFFISYEEYIPNYLLENDKAKLSFFCSFYK
jgi:hypothetical protein